MPYVISFVYFAIIYALNKEKHTTMSHWVGQTKTRSLVFGLVLGIGSLPIPAALAFYLAPDKGLPPCYLIIVLLAMVSLGLTLILPDKGGKWSTFHGIGAGVGTALMVVSALMFLILGNISMISALSLAIFVVFGTGIVVLMMIEKLGKATLILEIVFVVLWTASLFTLAFT
jgi:hypothetical protein